MAGRRHAGATVRTRNLHLQLSDEEDRALRMVSASHGSKWIGVFSRQILMEAINPRYAQLLKEGSENATAGVVQQGNAPAA